MVLFGLPVASFKFASNLALTLVLIVGHLLRLPYVYVVLFPRPLPLLPCMPKPVLSVKNIFHFFSTYFFLTVA